MGEIEVLGPGDEERVEAFLSQHPDSSMFLRSNMRRSGLVDGEGRFHGRWVAERIDGAIVGVAGVFWNGVLQIQAPEGCAALAQAAASGASRAIRGVVGPWEQVLDALAAVELTAATTTMNSREDLFALTLTDLVVPPALSSGRLHCRVAEQDDLELLTRWGVDYDVELKGHADDEKLQEDNRSYAKAYTEAGEMFVLEAGGVPASMCTWNARLPDTVQIGGVFTPKPLRGRGYARAVVAGCLQIACELGVQRSILFTGAQNAPARHAYLSIGFEVVGDYGIVLFAGEHDRRAKHER